MKKILLVIRDIIEIYIPVISFSIMFITFIVQIFSRRILQYPLTGAYEITVITFTWTVILGACYTMRYRSHVAFTLVYETLSRKKAAIARLLGNLIIIGTFSILIIPSSEFVNFMSFQATSVYKVSLSIVFAPFVYFLCSVIGYTLSEIITDVKIIKDNNKNEPTLIVKRSNSK